MRAGHARVTLTVPFATPMGGYVDRPGPSTGTLDPLELNVVTWSAGERRLALAVADVVCVNDDLARRAREIAGCDLWLAATHTHAGPETGCVPGGGPTPHPWLDRIAEAVGSAVREAAKAESPCDGTAHRGELHGVGGDRTDPAATPVVPLDVLAFRTDGRLTGAVVVLPIHPTVLPAVNRLVSADLPGATRTALHARLGPDVWVIVATGTAGDISTRYTRRGQDPDELSRLATLVADRCIGLLGEAPHGSWTSGDRLRLASRRLHLRREHVVVDEAALGADYARTPGDRLARSRLEGLRARTGATTPIFAEVNAARLGSLRLAALPGEPFLATGRSIDAVVLGYVNGYPGYLPTADAYRRIEYEVLASQVATGSAEALAHTARTLLEEL
ncbi:MAG: hypothetical protein K0R62_250 [Nonomuraea muscovyensis]|nr:hypothetical protein [Nonomuraea muscovyensis]